MSGPRRDPPEHALFVVKPGPLREDVIRELPRRLAPAGLTVVAQRRRRLSAADVAAAFKYAGPEYVELWTRDDCEALLARGRAAPARALEIKNALRRDHGRRREDIYNLLHLADSGWEFVHQFSLFFPSGDLPCYSGFADLLVPARAVPSAALLAGSAAGALGLVEASTGQLAEVRALGLDALWLLRCRVEGLAMLGLFDDWRAGEPDGRSLRHFCAWVRRRGGLVCLDENDHLLPPWPVPRDAGEQARVTPTALAACRTLVEPLLRLGLDGLVVVHPKRAAFPLEVLWELAENERLLPIGGTAGCAPPLSFAIDRSEVTAVQAALLSRRSG